MQKTALFILSLLTHLIFANDHRLVSLSNQMDMLYKTQSDSAILVGEKALLLADTLGADSMQISLHSRLGFIRKTKGEMFLAGQHYQKAIELERNPNSEKSANRRLNLGDIYCRTGEHDKAIETFQSALQFYETKNNIDGIVDALLGIGYTYQMMKSYNTMLKYYHQALSYEDDIKDQRTRAGVYNNLANGLKLTDDFDLAMSYYEKVVSISQSINDKDGKSAALNNIAGCYNKLGKHKKALNVYKEALALKKEIANYWGMANCLNNTAIVWLALDETDSALVYVRKGLQISGKTHSKTLLKNSHLILSNTFVETGQFDSAYIHLEMSASLKDSIFNETVTRQIAEMEAKYQSEKKERENAELRIDNLEKQERLNRHRRTTVYLIFALFVMGGLVWLYLYRYRMSKKLLLQEEEIHQQQEILHVKEEEILNQKVEHRNRELTSKAMAMVQKNELLLKLVEDIEAFEYSNDEKQSRFSNRIVSRIRREVEGVDEWEEFRKWYEETSGEFLTSLTSKYPDLTPTEIKLAALIRLELTTKDIASLLSREISTIEKGRYRLRKKLNLQPNENLSKYLRLKV